MASISQLKRRLAKLEAHTRRLAEEERHVVTFEFEDEATKDEFVGWLCDGGGEQKFMYDERFDGVTFDYDHLPVVKVTGKAVPRKRRS